MSTPLRGEGVIAEADFVHMQYLSLRAHRLLIASIVGLFLMVAVMSSSAILAVVLVVLLASIAVATHWTVKRLYWQHESLRDPTVVELRDDGVHFKQPYAESLVLWSRIRAVQSSDRVLLLYPVRNIAHVVPRHFFPGNGDFDRFVEAVKSRVGAARGP